MPRLYGVPNMHLLTNATHTTAMRNLRMCSRLVVGGRGCLCSSLPICECSRVRRLYCYLLPRLAAQPQSGLL